MSRKYIKKVQATEAPAPLTIVKQEPQIKSVHFLQPTNISNQTLTLVLADYHNITLEDNFVKLSNKITGKLILIPYSNISSIQYE